MKKMDYAAIEHAEHEVLLARERVRLLKVRALLSSGWKVEEQKTWRGYPRIVYAHPYPSDGGRRRCRDGSETTHYASVSSAFERLRRHVRRICGITSCERKPRKR